MLKQKRDGDALAAQESLALASGLAGAATVANTGWPMAQHGELEWTARLSAKQPIDLPARQPSHSGFYPSNLSSTEVRFCSFTQTPSPCARVCSLGGGRGWWDEA